MGESSLRVVGQVKRPAARKTDPELMPSTKEEGILERDDAFFEELAGFRNLYQGLAMEFIAR
jgi:hypothetical protein